MLRRAKAGVQEAACDLVVVGAGAAGMTASLVAALHGLKVVLVEASDQVGGTSATSAGTLWIPGSSHGARAGHADPSGSAREYLDNLLGKDDPRGLRAAYLASAAEAIDFLEAHSAVRFRSSGVHPDYLELPGAATAGRAISPVEFDGRKLGSDFSRVRAPMPAFMVLGGMMVGKADIAALLGRFRSAGNFIHTAKLVGRYAWDRLKGYQRGTRLVMGNALVARLLYSLKQARVDVMYGMRCESLLSEDGRVAGASVRTREGRVINLKARTGVVLCTGGVGHHVQLRGAFAGAGMKSYSLCFEGNQGEGIAAALAAGAALERGTPDFLWQPVSLVPGGPGGASLFPHLFLDRAKPGLLAVDRFGQRFVNEGSSYHHFVEGMRSSARGASTPGAPGYLVCNTEFVKKYGLGAIHPGTTRLEHWTGSGYIAVADTLEALADRLGIHPTGLRASVEQMNAAALAGHDPLFGKGATPVSRFNGDPTHAPNPCLGLLRSGPYVGLEIWAGESASSSGLCTTAEAEVVDAATGRTMPGLYACGNDMASLWQGSYPGPGATLGPAMVFAYRLVRRIVASA